MEDKHEQYNTYVLVVNYRLVLRCDGGIPINFWVAEQFFEKVFVIIRRPSPGSVSPPTYERANFSKLSQALKC